MCGRFVCVPGRWAALLPQHRTVRRPTHRSRELRRMRDGVSCRAELSERRVPLSLRAGLLRVVWPLRPVGHRSRQLWGVRQRLPGRHRLSIEGVRLSDRGRHLLSRHRCVRGSRRRSSALRCLRQRVSRKHDVHIRCVPLRRGRPHALRNRLRGHHRGRRTLRDLWRGVYQRPLLRRVIVCVCAAPISATPTRITTTAAFDGGVQLALGAGEVGAVWSATIATGSSIVFQRWAVDGMPLAVAIPLRTMPPGEGISGIDIAWNGAMWGVTWMETVGPIGARVSTTHFARLSPTGTMIGAPVDLTDGDFVGAAVLGWSPSLGFVAALSSRAAAFFRVIGADGSAPLPAVRYRPTSGIGAVGRDLVTARSGSWFEPTRRWRGRWRSPARTGRRSAQAA